MANNLFFKSVLLSIFAVLLPSSIGKSLAPTTKPTTSNNRLAVCQLPENTGSCQGYFPRWFYNDKTKTCQTFIYGGCNGNNNNFLSKAACELICKTSTQQGWTPFTSAPKQIQKITSKESRKLLDKKSKNTQPLLPTPTQNPTAKAVKPCVIEKKKAMDFNQSGIFVPKCDLNGFYEAMQCRQPQKNCWCVDKNGRKIGEVRTTAVGKTCDKIKQGKINKTALADSPCIKAVKKALGASILFHGMPIPVNVLRHSHIPKCNLKTGLFQPKQCHKPNCWCVNIYTGAEIKNTYGAKSCKI